jgi:hypothetical protein
MLFQATNEPLDADDGCMTLSAPSPPAARVNEEGKVLYACPEVRDLGLVGDVPSRIPTCHMGQFHCRVHGAHIIVESIIF